MLKPPSRPPPARLILSVVALLASAVVLAACDGDGERATADDDSAADGEVVGEVPDGGPTFRRECQAGTDRRPLEAESPRDDLRAGPVTFFAAGAMARRVEREFFRQGGPSGGRWRAFKSVTQISPPVETTVSVAEGDRSAFLLIYKPGKFRRDIKYFRSDGHATVVFGGCADVDAIPGGGGAVRFPGGFLARRPGCYRIAVASEADAEPVTRVVNVAMGRGACGEAD